MGYEGGDPIAFGNMLTEAVNNAPSQNVPLVEQVAAQIALETTPQPTSNFTDYSSVQAALDYEYLQWAAGNTTGPTQQGLAAREWWENYNAPSGGGGGGGGGGVSASSVRPTPISPWLTTIEFKPPEGVRVASPSDFTIVAQPESPYFLVNRSFEEIGGVELSNISRYDLINGDIVSYTPIANLSEFRRRFNPNNIISTNNTEISAFERFSIDLLVRGITQPYLDNDGNLVIEIDSVKNEEYIEAEIAQNGTMNRIEL